MAGADSCSPVTRPPSWRLRALSGADPGSASARNSSGARRSARTSAGWPSSSSAARRALAHVGAVPGASASERASALRRWAKAARTSARTAGRRRRAGAVEDDEDRVDVGHRVKDGARDRAVHAHVAGELGEHAGDAVGRRARRGGEALADLALDHGHPARDAVELLDGAQDRARRDAVGEVGDDLRRRGRQRAEVEVERVGDVQRRVRVRAPARPRSAGTSARSSSTTWTWAARAARCSLSTPSPPPISSTTSSLPRSAARSMTPRMFESMRKFWPRSRLGRTPNWRRRRRLGWVGSSPVTTRTAWQRWRRRGARAPRRRRRGARPRSARCG